MGPTDDNERYVVADPGAAGLDPAALDALVARARRDVDAGLLPSCQMALARHGRLAAFVTIGDAEPSSRYLAFSCTKALVAAATWLLVGEGALDVERPVADLVPGFGTNGKQAVTVEHLLVHTAGFPRAPLHLSRDRSREARLARFATWRLTSEPGTRFEYHPTSAHWVLGEVVEQVSGQDLRAFVHQRLVRPLGLRALRLGAADGTDPGEGPVNLGVVVGEAPSPAELEAATGIAGLDLATITRGVGPESLLPFNDPEVQALGVPGAGAVTTAADLALFYQALLHDPLGLWDPGVLADGTGRVRCDLPDEVLGVPAHRSLGLALAGEGTTATLRGFGRGVSPGTFGHEGAGGQIAWADPASGLSFAYLTNGWDADVLREGGRRIALSSRAAACAAAGAPRLDPDRDRVRN